MISQYFMPVRELAAGAIGVLPTPYTAMTGSSFQPHRSFGPAENHAKLQCRPSSVSLPVTAYARRTLTIAAAGSPEIRRGIPVEPEIRKAIPVQTKEPRIFVWAGKQFRR
jgi:hypothetical protein